jgi:NAD(P)-dependent dehydrogenase (short-subunit alcohol dehydrogenase family)
MRLKNKVTLITGGGRGIGAATAMLFASEGAKVAIASRTEKELFDVAGQIKTKYGSNVVLAHPADVSDEPSVRDLFSKILERFGPVEILVNNAATLEVGDFIDLKAETWDEIMKVNLKGAFLCSREAFHQMRDSGRGGVIVNLSSLGGIQGTPKFKGLSAYTVSKYGIVGLTECLAVEGKPFGIRVNGVAPGAVETAMLKKAAPFLKTRTTPEDVARTILFLCDEKESRSLTGTVIEIHSNE